MDDRVKELLDRVKETAVTMGEVAGTTARYAGQRAGQMVDVAKLNMKIFDLKADSSALLKQVGQLVYDTHRGQHPDTTPMDALLTKIDENYATIEEVKERISVLKHCKDCPSCGVVCGKGDHFCKDCGAAL